MSIKQTQPSDEELKHLGIPRVLHDEWMQLMGTLKTRLKLSYPKLKNPPNELIIGKIRIYGQFMNNKFIQLVVENDGTEVLTMRNDQRPIKTLKVVYTLLQEIKYGRD